MRAIAKELELAGDELIQTAGRNQSGGGEIKK